MYHVEGRNPVLEILRHRRVRKVLLAKGVEEGPKISEIIELARERGVPVVSLPRERLDRDSKTGRHQGVMALMDPLPQSSLQEILSPGSKEVCFVLLDKIQDPQNLGSILRTAEASGVDAVVVPKRGSVGLTPAVIRASMGGAFYVPLVVERLFPAIKLLRDEGVRIIGVDPRSSVNYHEVRLTGSVAFVLGGEGRGISKELLSKCDKVVRIPMKGRISSLNVGVAAAVVLYERLRQFKQLEETR